MSDPATTFNTPAGQTIAREKLIAYLNTGTSSTPVWSALGVGVTDSSAEYDWGEESEQDILGVVRNSMKKPKVTQSFDGVKPRQGDPAVEAIWTDGVKNQNPQALCNKDILLVHWYEGSSSHFAERYPSSMIKPSSIGGEGGGDLVMPLDISFGGERTVGTATLTNDAVTFAPAA